ncbi:MAG: threonine synthase [Streptosporangiales bacterium]
MTTGPSHDTAAPLTGQCVACAAAQSVDVPDYCLQCGAPVVLPPTPAPFPPTRPGPGVWRYAGRLPLPAGSSWLSLGEGGTPLLEAAAAKRWCGIDDLWLKLDHLNPTGSFKDRATAVGIAHAVARGASTVVCASSGNAAGSTAAYAAHAGLRAVLLVPEAVPVGKLAMARAHGAFVLRVAGDYGNSFATARELARRHRWINLSTTFVNPVAIAGLKSAGYELGEQRAGAVDWVLVPVGAGPLLYGIVAAFREFVAAGELARVPRVVAVQAEGCAPIAEALNAGATDVTSWARVETTISAIADPLRDYPGDGTYTLRLVRESAGTAVTVTDGEADEATSFLAERQGLLIEPGAAAVLPAARKLLRRGVIEAGDSVVCMLTGHGIKTLGRADDGGTPVVSGVEEATAELGGSGLVADR